MGCGWDSAMALARSALRNQTHTGLFADCEATWDRMAHIYAVRLSYLLIRVPACELLLGYWWSVLTLKLCLRTCRPHQWPCSRFDSTDFWAWVPWIFLLVPGPLEFPRVSVGSEPRRSVPIPEPPSSLHFPFLHGVQEGVALSQPFVASPAAWGCSCQWLNFRQLCWD